jgi:mono/diheme cytochrome c family protein
MNGMRGCVFVVLAVAMVALVLAGCSGAEPPTQIPPATPVSGSELPVVEPALWERAEAGKRVFNANCALCHGPNASGTGLGPPLVHKIYEPGHHQDFTIQSAVRNGVPAHHWQFGNMPPVPTVSDEDVPNIICYIRELQRANGIIAPDANLAAC